MTKYRISTPVLDFTGEVGGCHFAKGVYEGEVQPGPLSYFRTQGYGVEELNDKPAKPEKPKPTPPATPPTPPAPTFADDPKVAPAGNASADDWRAHALAVGATEDQVKDLGRDQLKELAAQITKEQQA